LFNAGDRKDLIFENVVPKHPFVQEPCQRLARDRHLTVEFVRSLLQKYWVLATVTAPEERQLARQMPAEWGGQDVLVRYAAAQIDLLAAPGIPPYVLTDSSGPSNNRLELAVPR
jgi:hypothetical protein